MAESRLPRPTYLSGALWPASRAVGEIMELGGPNTAWWALNAQPVFDWLFWPSVFFVLGLITQDLYNRKSFIWVNWRKWTAGFEVVAVQALYQDDPKRIEINVHIRFLRDIKSGQLILRTLMPTPSGPQRHSIPIETLSTVMKDNPRKILVATWFISYPGWTPRHHTWGPPPPDHMRGFINRSKTIATIELRQPWRVTQSHRFFVYNGDYHSSSAGQAIFVQDEDEDVFEGKFRA